MADHENIALRVLHDQSFDALHHNGIGEQAVSYDGLVHRELPIEQIGGRTIDTLNRFVPAAILEVAWDRDYHHINLLRQILPPTGTIFQVNIKLVEVRSPTIHDDEPRVLFRIGIQARET